ncbi:MAG: cyclase family protein [Clostridia bacterium]
MKVIDVTGLICNDMWSFGSLFPQPRIEEASGFCEGFGDYFYTEIKGMHTQVGTYLETPAHFYGFDRSFLIDDIPVSRLTNVGCVVLKVPKDVSDPTVHHAITKNDLLACSNAGAICPGDCIVVATGWDAHWMDDRNFFPNSPYFTYDAMMWIIAQKPSILATDTPAWENLKQPQGFFPAFYEAGILMLAPLTNLGAVTQRRVTMTALPLRVQGVAASPCRVVIVEDA